jgi:hypothetical protein
VATAANRIQEALATRLDAAEAGPLARVPAARSSLAPLVRRWRALVVAAAAIMALCREGELLSGSFTASGLF